MPTKFSSFIPSKVKTFDESSYVVGLYQKTSPTGYDNCLVESSSIKNVIDSKISTNDALVVHKSETETISGNKTFTGNNGFTGTTTFGSNTSGITAESSDSSTKFATTEFVQNVISSVLSSTLSVLYPIGSIYIGTQNTCPIETLLQGSVWARVADNRALWGSDGTNANTAIEAGLPNITGVFVGRVMGDGITSATGAFKDSGSSGVNGQAYGASGFNPVIDFKASNSNSIYGNSDTVQPPAYRVNVWRRIS